jgi:hypothetical protein
METTLYDDSSRTSVKKMKMEMSLDLGAGGVPEKKAAPTTKQARLNEMLATPELGLFMLASPDLERFIIQQNGLVLTTPTPTTQILFPKTVTEEQEAYARGFVDALGELHKNYGTPVVGAPGTSGAQGGQRVGPLTTTTTSQLPGSIFITQNNPRVGGAPQAGRVNVVPQRPAMFQPKVEGAQTVPTFTNLSIPASASAVNITPINLDDQESAKLDRKRARNRLAATRCRNRKLERISRLEERVKELKGQNTSLADTAAALRDQVCRLKQSIIEHTQSGCQVMLTHNLM